MSKFVIGRVVLPEGSTTPAITPINRAQCAVQGCTRRNVRTFEWAKDVRIILCQSHADRLQLEAVDG